MMISHLCRSSIYEWVPLFDGRNVRNQCRTSETDDEITIGDSLNDKQSTLFVYCTYIDILTLIMIAIVIHTHTHAYTQTVNSL